MKDLREQMDEFIEMTAGSAMVAEGFDEAFIGVASGFHTEPVAVYDREKVHNILCEEQNMTAEDAAELPDWWFDGTKAKRQLRKINAKQD